MTELLNNYLNIIIPYFPLGAIGVYRWSIWITKKIIAKKYKPIPQNKHTDTLSIVVPVYNEDQKIFQKALKSWLQNKPNEIIAVIDHTDTVCIKIFEKFQQDNKNSTLIITKKPGKRGALADGIRVAKYNIIALVDSDTIWDKNIKDTLLSPFIDPLVGGVGPRQDVLDTNTMARRLFNIHLDHRYFDEMTYLATVGDALTCLSGRTALYRKKAIKDLCDDLENETFGGAKCISGDDKCLTRLIQEKGWKVRYQANTRVLTPGVPDLLTFFKQQIRWTRNSYRSDLKSLMSKWIWKKEKFLAFHMIDRFTQPFTLILGPIYLIFSLIWGHSLIAGILVAWWHLSRGIKLYPHLKHRPADILILPFYILETYAMGILKIYALITIRQQGWITRWDKSRLQTGVKNIFRLLKSTLTYLATISLIALLSLGVGKYKNITTISYSNNNRNENIIFSDVANIETDQYQETILNNLNGRPFGYYTVKKDDTLSTIAWKYNANLKTIIAANKETIKDANHINSGQVIVIPISELKNTFDTDNLVPYGKARVTFDQTKNIIDVKGEGGIVNLSQINNVLNNENILQKLNNKEWLLKANLLIRDGATLVLNDENLSWLKLKSDQNGFVWLKSKNGNILIKNTRITSWNEEKKLPDTNVLDGRSFILAEYNGRMDIINSEISFLGYQYNQETEQSGGGLFGLSWKTTNDKLEKNILTGNIINNKIHDNYFGLYLYGSTGMIIANNEIFNNAQYGLDPHDGANNLIIKNNNVYGNGNHGIVLSKYVTHNKITDNISHDNKLHGLMLDQQSNDNEIANNTFYNNTDGIAIYDSHRNLIKNNNIKNNQNGVRANFHSSGNFLEKNNITDNKNGIYLYDNANNNYIIDNIIDKNAKGLYIKKSNQNLIKNSLKTNSNTIEIVLDNYSNSGYNLIERLD